MKKKKYKAEKKYENKVIKKIKQKELLIQVISGIVLIVIYVIYIWILGDYNLNHNYKYETFLDSEKLTPGGIHPSEFRVARSFVIMAMFFVWMAIWINFTAIYSKVQAVKNKEDSEVEEFAKKKTNGLIEQNALCICAAVGLILFLCYDRHGEKTLFESVVQYIWYSIVNVC